MQCLTLLGCQKKMNHEHKEHRFCEDNEFQTSASDSSLILPPRIERFANVSDKPKR